nr:retrovirus-related Pol polyprotein from transposon TNT 1-94 [Tanacetum cinerariifolium]
MRPFGCPVTILNTLDHLGKFDGKADKGFFIGYSMNSKAFRLFNSRTRIVEKTMHITFLKNKPNVAESEPTWLFDIDTLTKYINYKPVVAGNQSNGSTDDDDDDVGTKSNMTNLDTNILQVWTLVDLPYGKRAIGTKWICRNKKDERGIVVRNKARLVTQGYTQKEGINYDEVFTLVARIEAIWLFLAYASFKDFIVYQMDVKSTFLNGKIEKEVYVCQPLGFKDLEFPDRVYKVEKALYGLHQAPRAWPDIMFDVCACARFQVTPKVSHLHAVKRIFRYLKGQPKLGLWYSKDAPFDLEAYTDSDYAGVSLDRKSTTGGCQFLGS